MLYLSGIRHGTQDADGLFAQAYYAMPHVNSPMPHLPWAWKLVDDDHGDDRGSIDGGRVLFIISVMVSTHTV